MTNKFDVELARKLRCTHYTEDGALYRVEGFGKLLRFDPPSPTQRVLPFLQRFTRGKPATLNDVADSEMVLRRIPDDAYLKYVRISHADIFDLRDAFYSCYLYTRTIKQPDDMRLITTTSDLCYAYIWGGIFMKDSDAKLFECAVKPASNK